jgi:hypothetical protein
LRSLHQTPVVMYFMVIVEISFWKWCTELFYTKRRFAVFGWFDLVLLFTLFILMLCCLNVLTFD